MSSVKNRQRLERVVARRVVLDLIRSGHSVSVDNGEEVVLKESTKVRDILNSMFSVDEEHLLVHKDGKQVGRVFFVYGNDGYDAVNDYSTSLIKFIEQGVTEIFDKYS